MMQLIDALGFVLLALLALLLLGAAWTVGLACAAVVSVLLGIVWMVRLGVD